MRSFVLACMVFALASQSAQAQEWQTYREPQFGTTAAIPSDWRSEPIRGQPGVSGHYFYSPDGETWLAVFGRPVDADTDARGSATGPDERVTYRADGRRWFVRSGFKQDRIFYRKAVLSCGGSVAHLIAFEYPAVEKREHDRLVTRVSRSLRAGRGSASC